MMSVSELASIVMELTIVWLASEERSATSVRLASGASSSEIAM